MKLSSASLTTFCAGQTTPVAIRAVLRRVCPRKAFAGAKGMWGSHTRRSDEDIKDISSEEENTCKRAVGGWGREVENVISEMIF